MKRKERKNVRSAKKKEKKDKRGEGGHALVLDPDHDIEGGEADPGVVQGQKAAEEGHDQDLATEDAVHVQGIDGDALVPGTREGEDQGHDLDLDLVQGVIPIHKREAVEIRRGRRKENKRACRPQVAPLGRTLLRKHLKNKWIMVPRMNLSLKIEMNKFDLLSFI